MKKRYIALLLVVVVLVGGFVVWQAIPGEDIRMSQASDYAFALPEDLYEHTTLVAIGRYQGDIKSFADEFGSPETMGEVKLETILKGDRSEGDVIPVCFYGGTIPLWEYVSKRDDASLGKQGINRLAAMLSKATVTLDYDTAVKAREGERYLLFLNYSPERRDYFVMADSYGMRHLDESGRALNPDSQTYENIPDFQ